MLPRLANDAADAPAVVLVGVEVLQPAPDHLVRVRDGAGHELGRARQHHGRLVADFERSRRGCRRRCVPLTDTALVVRQPSAAPRKVDALGRLVHGKLYRAVAHADEADAQSAVETPEPFVPEQLGRPCPHARVRAHGPAIRREHAHLEDPDGIGQDLNAGAGERGSGKVVRGGEGHRAIVV